MSARARLWQWHRWLGLLSCIGILMWALSGMLHPLMSRMQPKPAAFMPPAVRWTPSETPSPRTHLEKLGIGRLDSLHAVQFDGRMHWLAHHERTGLLIDARSGEVVPGGEQKLAESLARHYTGLRTERIRSTRLITAFDEDYLSVNRLLPVWRVDFERPDGLSAYIDTAQMRLATLNDDTKRRMGAYFRWSHNWAFLDGWPRLRPLVMTVLLGSVAASALTGLYFWWRGRRQAAQRLAQKPTARWHRRLGLLVALTSLSFTFSGGYHLLHPLGREAPPPQAFPPLERAALHDEGWDAVQGKVRGGRLSAVAQPEGVAWWSPGEGQGAKAQVASLSRVAESTAGAHDEHAEHAHHHPARPMASSGPLLLTARGGVQQDGARHLARALALRFSGLPAVRITEVAPITRFEGEYGFINKRLPVWRVAFDAPGHPRYYVELATGTLAARVDDADAREGWSFSVLHKWNIGRIDKDWRDAMAASFALGHVIVAALGLAMFLRPKAASRLAPAAE